MKSKKNLITLSLIIVISLFGITYAFFDYYKLGNNQEIIAGRVSLILNEGTDTIDISNVFPETAVEARSRDDNQITFTITGHNTTVDNDIYYEIMLNEGDSQSGKTRFKPYDLKFDLIEIDENKNEVFVFEKMSFEDFNGRRIWVNTVDRNTSEDITKTYKLRMWLDENVIVSDTNPSSDYPATGFENYYASVKVSVFGDFVEKDINYQPNYMARYNEMQFWPMEFMQSMQSVSEVKFVAMGESELETRYNAASIKTDVTRADSTVQQTSTKQLSNASTIENSKGGKVYAWLEPNTSNDGFNVLYVASDGFTYLPSDCSLMFSGFMNVTNFTFENINTSEVTNMGGMFYYCTNIKELDLKKFDTSKVTSFSKLMTAPDGTPMYMGMFGYCWSLSKINMNGWDTSKVTNMSNMFDACYSLTGVNLSQFNTSNVVDMSGMFEGCTQLFRLDLRNFDTSNVTNMSYMFSYCTNLTILNIDGWNTGSLTNASYMFDDCRSLTSLNVSHFNTENVTDMSGMFRGLQNVDKLDVSNFNTSKVTDMSMMFGESTDIGGGGLGITTLDVSNFDTSNVENLYGLFSGCSKVKVLEVNHFNTSKVTNMDSVFAGVDVVSLDLSNWDTSKATTMGSLFADCRSLVNLNITGWDTSNVTDMSSMFKGCTNLNELNLSHLDVSEVIGMADMFNECTNLRSLNISNFSKIVSGTTINVNAMVKLMPTDARIVVASNEVVNYILSTDEIFRPAAWTSENFIV